MQGLKQRLLITAFVAASALAPLLSVPARAQDAAGTAAEDPALAPEVTVSPDAVATPPDTAAVPQVTVTASPVTDPVALAIRGMLTGPEAISGLSQKDRAAIAAFYAEAKYQPLWLENGRLGERARAAITRIAAAASDGLDPSAFALPDPEAATGDPAADAATDVGLSVAVVRFAEEATGGRVAPSTISKDITRTPPTVDPKTALAKVAAAGDPAAVLDGFNPPHEEFRRLKAKLAEIRDRGEEARQFAPIATGPSLKPGMRDPRVPALRERLGLPAAEIATGSIGETETASASDDELLATVEKAIASSTDEVYDPVLVDAVKSFQSANGLESDGVVGSRTLGLLNGEPRDEEGEVLANMEMWRWMPRDLGSDYVFVNVPEFMVRVVRDGRQIHETRVVVGKTANQTPIFSDEMEYLVVNPYWHVPESIKIKEMLPEIRANPRGYMARHGYEVTWEGEVIDPASIVWDENAMRAVGIRQMPGEANALGHVKFMFPNKHAVYLHDTPSRALFKRTVRAFSHGCVRVDDPLAFAGAILRDDPDWTVDRLQALYGGPEQRVNLSRHLQVHIAYMTAWVDDKDVLQIRDDLYGHMRKIKEALGRPA